MSETPSPVATAIGWLLFLLGALWLVLTGGCTVVLLVSQLGIAVRYPNMSNPTGVASILAAGAICIAPGLGMFLIGRRLLKGPRRAKPG